MSKLIAFLKRADNAINTFVEGIPYDKSKQKPLTPLDVWLDKWTWKGNAPWQD